MEHCYRDGPRDPGFSDSYILYMDGLDLLLRDRFSASGCGLITEEDEPSLTSDLLEDNETFFDAETEFENGLCPLLSLTF